MKLYKWLAGVAVLACSGQAQAVTYYHIAVDFAIKRTYSPPGIGGEIITTEGSHIDVNLTSDPSQPQFYYGPGADLLQFVANDATITLQYDLAALNASTSANPISTSTFVVFPHFGSRETVSLLFASNAAYASATPTGTLGITAGPGFAPRAPEPATWTMMIAGFGLVGSAMRHRRTTRLRFA